MRNVEIVLDYKAIGELLQSEEVSKVCTREAERMTRATGAEYTMDSYKAQTRVVSETLPPK